ncbi:MBL fold metallo-hydrolase [Streptomyces candidus]|uniref:Glyoxylase-like metal-dependent hydrolase (Beta-lactamase superfamily II) n=1 Tax=Streptomyces candidus TaxID=67283 RepID=A0A7X0LQR0_9ACTN|nr:MBL fold metallo-hydrolase [Streptomyces candidus]MBB6437863.1 glyoxylase-like metal-dependent hydrolase (beta-lactamase superfamily II) [Streptomyces candidus]GHH49941.1 MBL fold metallo-hydrolase [Streptomyces candidus]
MDLVEILPHLHMLRFPIGQAYLWREQGASGTELTLIDAGHRDAAADIERAIRSLGRDPRDLRRIVLTHCHRDHVGAAEELAARYGAQVLAHRLDAPVVRGDAPTPEPDLLDWEVPLYRHGLTVPPAPPTRVDRELEDGDLLGFGGGARVVHAPGHTDGSIGVHLPHHGVLFTGDCVAAVGEVMLGVFNVDRPQALATMRRLASLAPSVACFGHGDPLTEDAATRLLTAAEQASSAG